MIKRTLTRLVISLAILGINELKAQEQKAVLGDKINRSVYLELLGPSNLVGISYDSRIAPKSKWGYRLGVAYNSNMNSIFSDQYSSHAFTTPVEVNYLLGRKRHKLELGVGVSLGIYSEKIAFYTNDRTSQDLNIQKNIISQKSFGYYLYSNIGYRYQADKGFLFRVGVSPSFNFGDRYGVRKRPLPYPYLAFGYSF